MSDVRLKILAVTAPLVFFGLTVLAAELHYSSKAELPKETAAATSNQQATDFNPKAGGSSNQTGEIQPSTACTNPEQLALSEPAFNSAESVISYTPRQGKSSAHPTNYGERLAKDVYGKSVNNQLLVVLHETVAPAASTMRFFQTPHKNDSDQASYHALITKDGTIVYFIPPEKRAFGAGNSVFEGPNGPETVKVDPNLPPSVNNFAYHISLETPANGMNNRSSHSGYTEAQYQSLAWLVARTQVPDQRITTHKAVDRSGDRQDPRSFDSQKFLELLRFYPRPDAVVTRC